MLGKKEKKMSNISISNECNMKLMARYPDNYFDLAIVDPPYGYGKKETQILNFRQKKQHRDWNTAPNKKYFKELFRVSQNQIIWGGNYFPFIWKFGGRGFIYWHKGNPVKNFADGEMAWTSFDKNAQQYDYRYYGNLEGNGATSKKFHPTQKPVSLYEWLLMNYAKPNDKILDTHGGSMSIALAVHNVNSKEGMNLSLDICELDKEYYKQGKLRYENHIKQKTIFDI